MLQRVWAGRISYIELTPFSFLEAGDIENLWLRGGFPKSFLSKSLDISLLWRKDYIKTFLERDIVNLGIDITSQNMRRFWMMLSHNHGQIFNSSEIGRSLNLSHVTSKKYLDILTGTFMVRQLQPWHENIKKRQIKSPKIYIRDSGILHSLLNIGSKNDLIRHIKLGSSWEGFAMEEIIKKLDVDNEDVFFWATQGGAELDLLVLKNGKRFGFEFKFNDAPTITKSMRIAIDDLKLDSLRIIYPGQREIQIEEEVYLISLKKFIENH